jgi:hypothetical protein
LWLKSPHRAAILRGVEKEKRHLILRGAQQRNTHINISTVDSAFFETFYPVPAFQVPRTPLYVPATLYIMSLPYFAHLGPKQESITQTILNFPKKKKHAQKRLKETLRRERAEPTRRKYKIFLCRLTPATNIGFTKRANFANLLDEAVMFVIYVKALSVSSAATVRAAARPPRLALAHTHSHILTLYYRDT